MKIKPLPPFKTIEEEAKFWDLHSFADYENRYSKLHKAKSEKLTEKFNIKITPTLKRTINTEAQKNHLKPSTFIRSKLSEMFSTL